MTVANEMANKAQPATIAHARDTEPNHFNTVCIQRSPERCLPLKGRMKSQALHPARFGRITARPSG